MENSFDMRDPDAAEMKKDMDRVEHALKRTRVQIAGAKRLLQDLGYADCPETLLPLVHILAINQAAGDAGMR